MAITEQERAASLPHMVLKALSCLLQAKGLTA
jgi:hypothetical protein